MKLEFLKPFYLRGRHIESQFDLDRVFINPADKELLNELEKQKCISFDNKKAVVKDSK